MSVCYQHDPLGLAHALLSIKQSSSAATLESSLADAGGLLAASGSEVAIVPPWAPTTVFLVNTLRHSVDHILVHRRPVTSLSFSARSAVSSSATVMMSSSASSQRRASAATGTTSVPPCSSTSPSTPTVVARLAITTDNHDGRLFVWVLRSVLNAAPPSVSSASSAPSPSSCVSTVVSVPLQLMQSAVVTSAAGAASGGGGSRRPTAALPRFCPSRVIWVAAATGGEDDSRDTEQQQQQQGKFRESRPRLIVMDELRGMSVEATLF